MRLLNAVDTTMTNSHLVKAARGFICICRLKHQDVQSFKTGERGGDFRDGPFNILDNARKSSRRNLQRDGMGIIGKVALFGDDRHDLDEIAYKAGMHVRSPKGCGQLACVSR